MRRRAGHAAVFALPLMVAACSGGGSGSVVTPAPSPTPTPTPTPPTVDLVLLLGRDRQDRAGTIHQRSAGAAGADVDRKREILLDHLRSSAPSLDASSLAAGRRFDLAVLFRSITT